MLQELHIENIAVIEQVSVNFTPGLNVLTGETGAGKSIIIDALQAVMGARTSRELVRTGAEKASASAVFSIDWESRADQANQIKKWFEESEIDIEDEIILQRKISSESAGGKSSCRVSGTPVTAAQMKELSSRLLDIHGQNDGRQLLDEGRHREYLDEIGGHGAEIADFMHAYYECRATFNEIKRLKMDTAEKDRLLENLNIVIKDIEDAHLREGEMDALLARRNLLKNSEKLTEAMNAAYSALYSNDVSAISLTDKAASEIGRAAELSDDLSELLRAVMDASFTLKDAADTLRDRASRFDFSPEEFDKIESRLELLQRLSKRYGADESGLISKLAEAKEKLGEIEHSDDKLKELMALYEKQKRAAVEAGGKLTVARKKAAVSLQSRIEEELKVLAMPAVSIVVDITPTSDKKGFDATGADEVKFLMSANKGEKPGPISKIASGGELSRIMLALKNVFSESDIVETLVFDEIDTGVSGVAAQRVGEKLAELSRRKQVLCVTHLPQIACMADTHFLIEKKERGGRTFTSVTKLTKEGRKKELARLLGGEAVTEKTLLLAEEQLSAAEKFKYGIKNRF